MGQCYENEQIKSQAAAIRCYTRAVDSGDREGTHSLSGLSSADSATCASPAFLQTSICMLPELVASPMPEQGSQHEPLGMLAVRLQLWGLMLS